MHNNAYPPNQADDFQTDKGETQNTSSTKETNPAKEDLGDYVDFEEIKEDN